MCFRDPPGLSGLIQVHGQKTTIAREPLHKSILDIIYIPFWIKRALYRVTHAEATLNYYNAFYMGLPLKTAQKLLLIPTRVLSVSRAGN